MNTDCRYLKNSPSICYIFFAVHDRIVTSVNTYTSVMGFSTENKYLMKCLRENQKYGAKQLLKMFPNKKWSLVDWKRWSKKLKIQILLFDVLGSGQPRTVHTMPVLSIFLISIFSPPRLQFLLGNILSNHFAPCFLFSRKDLIKYLIILIIDV